MVELRRSTRVAAGKRESEADLAELPPVKKSKSNGSAPKKEKPEPVSKKEEQTTEVEKKELDEGDDIPDLKLENQDGEEISLKKVAEENRIIIIFAYPKASTPGCTRQACGFRDNYDDLKEHAAVFGLSTDNPKGQKAFQTKQKLPYDLLCDPKRVLIGFLGAKKTAQSGTIRSHWIFVDGKLKSKHVKVSPEVSVEEGKKEVLELAKELGV